MSHAVCLNNANVVCRDQSGPNLESECTASRIFGKGRGVGDTFFISFPIDVLVSLTSTGHIPPMIHAFPDTFHDTFDNNN